MTIDEINAFIVSRGDPFSPNEGASLDAFIECLATSETIDVLSQQKFVQIRQAAPLIDDTVLSDQYHGQLRINLASRHDCVTACNMIRAYAEGRGISTTKINITVGQG